MADNNALIVVDKLDPIEIFVKGGLDSVIETISKRADEELKEATLETAKGRKLYASVAWKIARSKTLLDDMGKELTIEQKRQIKKNDENRNLLWERCEKVQAEKRKPLTDWETAEESRIAKDKADAELLQEWTDAISEDDLFNRQKAIEAKEAEFAKIEAELKAKEASERAERERLTAIESAKREAELAEQRRIEAERKTKDDQDRAVKAAEEKAKKEAEAKERERLAAEARAKAEAERIAANRSHQAKINKEAMTDFMDMGFDEAKAKAIVIAIAAGKVRNVKIMY